MMRGMYQNRRFLIAGVHAMFIVGTYGMASMVVSSFEFHAPSFELFLKTVPIVLAIKLAMFYRFGLFSGWWQYTGISDLRDITFSSAASSAVLALLLLFFLQPLHISAVLLVDLLFTITVVGGSRVIVRAYTESATNHYDAQRNTIIVGAGHSGSDLVRELLHYPDLDYNPVAFVDDDGSKLGLKIHGIKVLGSTTQLPDLIAKLKIQAVIVAIHAAPAYMVQRVLEACSKAGVEFKILPALSERVNGSGFTMLRNITMEDLLGREPVSLDLAPIQRKFKDRVVLVTGAGGSIGSELVRQLVRFLPRKLILLDRSENDLFKLGNSLNKHSPLLTFVPCIADIADVPTLRTIFARYRPNSVFHAAAYKHVPMMEINCFQAISNNIFGTYNVARVSQEHEVEDFIMISTDKAVNPSSMMGVTKRVAELIILALQNGPTRFTTVRFGNVMGSNGSVLPLFQEQIAAGGPVTVTHPNAVRFFMTIPEAVQLVLQASTMGHGGEIFVLDMGKPVSILEVARNMIRLAGLVEGRDIPIVFTGLRPGEKLFEELKLDAEGLRPTHHSKIGVLEAGRPDTQQVHAWLDELSAILAARNVNALIVKLREIVPAYTPSRELLELCYMDRYDPSWRYMAERVKSRAAKA